MGASKSKDGKKLSKAEIQELLDVSKLKPTEIKQWYAEFKKDYPDGWVNMEQFNSLYTRLYKSDGEDQEKTNHIFRSFDLNNDCKLSFKELVSTVSVLRRGTIREKMEFMFHIYDVDNNGFITLDELTSVVNSMQDLCEGYKYTTSSITALFPNIDWNKDDRLSMDEFAKGVEGNQQLAGLLNQGQVLPLV